jgi:hypothetical protein
MVFGGSVRKGLGLDQQLNRIETIRRELCARENSRNCQKVKIHWTYIIAAARRKLHRRYPFVNG